MPHEAYIPKALLRRRDKPLLIWASPPLLILLGLQELSFSILLSFDQSPATISIGGEVVTRTEYLLYGLPIGLAMGGAWLLGGVGLLIERLWARMVMTVGIPMTHLAAIGVVAGLNDWIAVESLRSVLIAMAIAGALYWYFFRYKRVTEYYIRLQNRRLQVER